MELFERHFDAAFDAQDGIKKLRELILTLAMRGKLVPQDSNDPPASELLEKIEAEKKRLVKEGKLSEPKRFSPVTPDEAPHALPNGWKWVRLGMLGVINPRNVSDNGSIVAGFVPMALIDDGYSGRHSFEQRQWLEIKNGFTHIANGDIGMAKITPCFENAKSCVFKGLPGGIGAGTTELHVFRNSFESLVPEFLLYHLKNPTFISVAARKMTGSAGQKRVPTVFFSENPFPLPPMKEQYRIVAKVDELMARCDALENLRVKRDAQRLAVHTAAVRDLLSVSDKDGHIQAREFLDQHFSELYTVRETVAQLRKTILQLAIMGKLVPQDPNDPPASEFLKQIEGEKKRLVRAGQIREPKPFPVISPSDAPYEIPESWKWIRLGDAGSFERGRSKHRPRNDHRLFDGGIYPFVQTGDVSRSKLTGNQILTCGSYYNETGLKQSRLWEKGRLCITIAANIAETGYLGMDACVPDSVVVFLGVDRVLEQLVKLFIDVAKDDLEHFAPSTAQKNINLGIINQLLFPLPPLREQRRIISRFDHLMAKCDELEQGIRKSRDTQSALLNAVMAEFGGQQCA